MIIEFQTFSISMFNGLGVKERTVKKMEYNKYSVKLDKLSRTELEELDKNAPLVLKQCKKAFFRAIKDLDFMRIDPNSFQCHIKERVLFQQV